VEDPLSGCGWDAPIPQRLSNTTLWKAAAGPLLIFAMNGKRSGCAALERAVKREIKRLIVI
jgi:hypothetical protein